MAASESRKVRPTSISLRLDRAHQAEIDRKEYADGDQRYLGGFENAEPENEQRHPGDRGDGTQRLQAGIDEAPQPCRRSCGRADDRRGDGADDKTGRDARQRDRRVAREVAAPGEIGEGREDHGRRRRQAPARPAPAHRDFPGHGERRRQQETKRRSRIAAKPPLGSLFRNAGRGGRGGWLDGVSGNRHGAALVNVRRSPVTPQSAPSRGTTWLSG